MRDHRFPASLPTTETPRPRRRTKPVARLWKRLLLANTPAKQGIVALLDQFVEQGLMIRAGKQYLSLAVVREFGHQEHSEP
jgi:hypothetical protein